MRLHRFYVPPETAELGHDFWLHDERLLAQWNNVLRFRPGRQVVLFDSVEHDRMYKIDEISKTEAHLLHVTDFQRKVPARDVYLFWSLLKKDKNDWVLQKCTELGVSHFVPLLADRSEKTGFNPERAEKIIIEAAEQCGRSDIPSVREPALVQTVLDGAHEGVKLYICEQDSGDEKPGADGPIGVFIGPEGGWSDAEKALFKDKGVNHLNLHDFTLRAETAAVMAVGKLV